MLVVAISVMLCVAVVLVTMHCLVYIMRAAWQKPETPKSWPRKWAFLSERQRDAWKLMCSLMNIQGGNLVGSTTHSYCNKCLLMARPLDKRSGIMLFAWADDSPCLSET